MGWDHSKNSLKTAVNFKNSLNLLNLGVENGTLHTILIQSKISNLTLFSGINDPYGGENNKSDTVYGFYGFGDKN